MAAVAKQKIINKKRLPPTRRTNREPTAPERLSWPSEEPEEATIPERGPEAVQHNGITRGRRSKQFPDLNITATAAKLGVTKSHLAKVLAGKSKPSLDLAVKLADALDKDLLFVAALGHNRDVDNTSTAKADKTRKKRKTRNG